MILLYQLTFSAEFGNPAPLAGKVFIEICNCLKLEVQQTENGLFITLESYVSTTFIKITHA